MHVYLTTIIFYLTDSEESHSWQGDWVLVYYGGKKYPGSVTAVNGANVEVDCLEKSGKDGQNMVQCCKCVKDSFTTRTCFTPWPTSL